MTSSMTSPTSPPPARRRRLPVRVAAALLGAAVVFGAAAAPPAGASTAKKASAAPRVTFGVEPASVRGADGRPYFSFGATAGAVLEDHFAALNYSTKPVALQLYATDAVETAGGGFGLLPSTTKPTGAGAWITMPSADSRVVVPARSAHGPGQVVVPILLRIPDKVSPGDHTGGIVAAVSTTGTNANGQRVVLVLRVATRVYVRVAGPLAPAVAIKSLHATYSGTLDPFGEGRATVSYLVTNTGNVNLAVTGQAVSLSGLIGDRHEVQLPSIPLLLPGASVLESTAFAGVWPQLRLNASVSLQPVELPGFGTPARLGAVGGSTGTWAIPFSMLVLVVLVAAAAAVALRLRSRRAAVRRRGGVGTGSKAPESGLAGA
jgi:hypothetical protein